MVPACRGRSGDIACFDEGKDAMTPADLYIDGIKKKLKNHWAAWLPSEKLKLGDVGILDGRLFTRVTSLSDLGITFKERPDTDSTPIDYVSDSGVTMYFKAAGEASAALPSVPQGKAGIGVDFSATGAFVLKAAESYEPTMDNIVQVEKDVIKAYKAGRWKSEWAVIVRLIRTPVATIMISNSSASKIEFSAEADLALGTTVDLGRANLDFGVRMQKGDIIKFPQAKNLTPLFQLARVKSKPWYNPLGSPSFAIKAVRADRTAMAAITPERARENPDAAESLYLDLVTDSD
jgi:hypothetical protein